MALSNQNRIFSYPDTFPSTNAVDRNVPGDFFISQLNLHRSPTATDELLFLQKDIDIVQEMPLKQDGSAKIFHPCKNIYMSHRTHHPRAAVLVHKNIQATCVTDYTSKDLATIAVKLEQNKIIYIASLYCHSDDPPTGTQITELVRHCNVNRIPLLIGTDSNSHSEWWGGG